MLDGGFSVQGYTTAASKRQPIFLPGSREEKQIPHFVRDANKYFSRGV
jgi:hypothetical protein